MNIFVSFIKNLLSLNSEENYIGLAKFSNTEVEVYDKPQIKRKKDSELTLSELLRKN